MSQLNPYQIPAGPELDQLIHRWVMGSTARIVPPIPPKKKKPAGCSRLKTLAGRSVIVGKTAMRRARWFARYETDPSDGTEVLADSLALAICRLALIHVIKEQDLSSADAS